MESSNTARGATDNLIGIGFMLMSVLAGLITATVVKRFSVELSVLTVLSVRFLYSMPLLILFGLMIRQAELWRINRWDMLTLRMFVGHLGIIFWFLSVRNTSLGQATALFQSSAIFVTILAPILLQEKVGLYRGGAVVVGLIGIVMITNPFTGSLNIGSFWGIMSALAGAALIIALRKLGKSDAPISVALWHNGLGSVLYPCLLLLWMPAEAHLLAGADFLLIFIIFGMAASLVQFGFTSAYRYGEAVVLVPMRYLSVPASALIGWIYWQEEALMVEMLGMGIVVASCIFISFREYYLGRTSKIAEAFLHKS